jgi:hypothetical protein
MGSGYRVFTAGEVLTASNVQNYLQDQAVMVFGGTAARSSAIGTANFEEGMLTYLTDVDKLQVYTGATFADVYPAAASTQGLTLINTTSFSGVASTSLAASTFNSTYRNYRIILNFRPATNNTTFNWRIRKAGSDVTTSTYFLAGTSTQSGSATISSYRVNAGTSFSTNADIPNSADTIVSFDITDTTNSNQLKGFGSIMSAAGIYYSFGFVNSTADTADSMTFYMSSGNITGRYQVFGYNE